MRTIAMHGFSGPLEKGIAVYHYVFAFLSHIYTSINQKFMSVQTLCDAEVASSVAPIVICFFMVPTL